MLKICKLFILTIILGGFFVQQGYCADRYYWLNSSDTITYSLDTQTFNGNVDGDWAHFDVWIKMDYNEDGVQQVISARKKFGLTTVGYEKLGTTLEHQNYMASRSAKLMCKNIQHVDYDINGNILDSITFPSSNSFTNIVPDSIGEANLLAIVLYYNAKMKKELK